MEPTLRYFLGLAPSEQVNFLREGKHNGYARLDRRARIGFIKALLKSNLSSRTTATALKTLRKLGYNDKYFYRKYLYHIDTAVSKAAKKAISQAAQRRDSQTIRVLKMFREGRSEDRVIVIKYFLKGEGRLNEDIIISLLAIDDQRMRDALVQGIGADHNLDDCRLAEAVTAGTIWFARAALVTILGNRKSHHLLDIADFLVKDLNVEVRLAFINALTKFPLDQARVHLEKLTHDPLIWVRKRAQKALQKLAR